MQMQIEGFECEAKKGNDYGLAYGSVAIVCEGMLIGSGSDLRDAVADARQSLIRAQAKPQSRN